MVAPGIDGDARTQFTRSEAEEIRQLLARKRGATPSAQKSMRRRLRALRLYLSEWSTLSDADDFERLVSEGRISIVEGESDSGSPGTAGSSEQQSDEEYLLDLCDQILGFCSSRGHQFGFLRGDPGKRGKGTMLPVDGYYPSLRLAIEYHERQHSEGVPFFDKPHRLTVSGVPRGEQRAIYDQRRRDVLPEHGIHLVELSYADFAHGADKRLSRHRDHDIDVLRRRLASWIPGTKRARVQDR